MTNRKSIPKKVRFEVFKRDSFSCQYCGASAPESILHVDHIHPVSKGGDNDILNLITACQSCNSGKGATELDDDSMLAKQRAQLQELNSKREQLEMMIQWRQSLRENGDMEVDAIRDEIDAALIGRSVNDNGAEKIRKWVKKYGIKMILECVDISANQYLETDDDGDVTADSAGKFFDMIPRIASNRSRFGDDEERQSLYYARGILRRRLNYCNDQKAIQLLSAAKDAGVSVDDLIAFSKTVRSWTEFKEEMEALGDEDNG